MHTPSTRTKLIGPKFTKAANARVVRGILNRINGPQSLPTIIRPRFDCKSEENGQKGFFVMNDNWFADFTFEIAARKSYLPAELQAALNQEPIVLPAWDPMGALAR